MHAHGAKQWWKLFGKGVVAPIAVAEQQVQTRLTGGIHL
jgi:hypothetical protein